MKSMIPAKFLYNKMMRGYIFMNEEEYLFDTQEPKSYIIYSNSNVVKDIAAMKMHTFTDREYKDRFGIGVSTENVNENIVLSFKSRDIMISYSTQDIDTWRAISTKYMNSTVPSNTTIHTGVTANGGMDTFNVTGDAISKYMDIMKRNVHIISPSNPGFISYDREALNKSAINIIIVDIDYCVKNNINAIDIALEYDKMLVAGKMNGLVILYKNPVVEEKKNDKN